MKTEVKQHIHYWYTAFDMTRPSSTYEGLMEKWSFRPRTRHTIGSFAVLNIYYYMPTTSPKHLRDILTLGESSFAENYAGIFVRSSGLFDLLNCQYLYSKLAIVCCPLQFVKSSP